MKRILPATLLGAALAIGSFGAVAAYAATPAQTLSAIVAETDTEPVEAADTGTEPAEATSDTALDPAGGLESQVDFQGDSQSEH